MKKNPIRFKNEMIRIIEEKSLKFSPDQQTFINKAFRSVDIFLDRIAADSFWEKTEHIELSKSIQLIFHTILLIDANILIEIKSGRKRDTYSKRYFNFFDNYFYRLFRSFWEEKLNNSNLYKKIEPILGGAVAPTLLNECFYKIDSSLIDSIFKYKIYGLFWEKYCDYLTIKHLRKMLQQVIQDNRTKLQLNVQKPSNENIINQYQIKNQGSDIKKVDWDRPLYELGKLAYEMAIDMNWPIKKGWKWASDNFSYQGKEFSELKISRNFYKKYPTRTWKNSLILKRSAPE